MSRSTPFLAALAAAFAAPALAAEPDAPAWRGSLDSLASGQGVWVAASAANPENVRLLVPQAAVATELRPNLRVDWGRLQLVLRPRFFAEAEKTRAARAWRDAAYRAGAEWTELYGAWTVSDGLSLAYGLQVFQWGPAELLSPSNRLFHDLGLTRNVLTAVPGRHLVRVNASRGKNLSALVVAEVEENREAPFAFGEAFDRKGQLKVELTSDDGTRYLGLTAGTGETTRSWVGEYGALALADGLSVYADVCLTRGSRAWYPVDTPLGPRFDRPRIDSDRVYALGLAGLRYTFEGGTDLKAEFLHQDAGWTTRELDRAVRIVRDVAAIDPRQLGPYASPGLELPGKNYLYLSARLPDLPPAKRFTLSARHLLSTADRSGALMLTAEAIASDAWLLFASATWFHGGPDRELTRLARAVVFVASRVSW